MNENVKTIIYVAVAALFGVAAYATLPRTTQNTGPDQVGKPLFPGFDDTAKAASLEITWFDDTLSAPKSFKVAKDQGKWVVPSHDNYPADADTQLKDAATSLFQLDCLDIATEVAAEHKLYGVVEPPKEFSGTTEKEFGKLIVLQDSKADDLVRILVGKEVEGRPGQRFVRIAESGGSLTDQVYITRIDPDKLATDFGKWIERDLLQLNPNDVKQLTLKDYSIVRTQNQRNAVQLKMDAKISWDTIQGIWNLDIFQLYDDRNKAHDAQVGEGEELAKTKLDDLKNALDDLKIESVDRKPEGLGADLALDEKLLANEELMTSLAEHGFFAGPRDDKLQIFSRNGEVNVDCADGVRYVLRFGDVAGVQEGAGLDKLNRYLLVSVQLAENMLAKPVLEEEPAGPEASPPAADPATKTPMTEGSGCQEESKTDEPNKTDTKAKDDTKSKADTKAKVDGKAKPAIDPDQQRRQRIKLANERLLKDYEEKHKKAQGRVASLNARFANWYYVISEDTYKKIHLGRADIIQEGASAKDSGFGVDAFRKLESEGLKKSAPPMAGGSPGGFPGGGFPGAP